MPDRSGFFRILPLSHRSNASLKTTLQNIELLSFALVSASSVVWYLYTSEQGCLSPKRACKIGNNRNDLSFKMKATCTDPAQDGQAGPWGCGGPRPGWAVSPLGNKLFTTYGANLGSEEESVRSTQPLNHTHGHFFLHQPYRELRHLVWQTKNGQIM